MKYCFDKWINLEKESVVGFEVVDLSVPICENAEVPGEKGYSDPDTMFKRIETKPWVSLAIKPYYISKVVIGAHVGTHIDSPMHVKEDGASVDKIPNEFIGPIQIVEANDSSIVRSIDTLQKESIVVVRGKSNYKISDKHRMAIIRSNPSLVVFGDCVNVDGVEDTIQYLQNDIPMIMGADQSALEQLNEGDVLVAMPIKFSGIEAAPVRLFALKLQVEQKSLTNKEDIFVLDE